MLKHAPVEHRRAVLGETHRVQAAYIVQERRRVPEVPIFGGEINLAIDKESVPSTAYKSIEWLVFGLDYPLQSC